MQDPHPRLALFPFISTFCRTTSIFVVFMARWKKYCASKCRSHYIYIPARRLMTLSHVLIIGGEIRRFTIDSTNGWTFL